MDKKIEQLLESAKQKFGFVPNVLKTMAKSPATLQTYLQGMSSIGQYSELTKEEQQIISLLTSNFNECEYCSKAHSKTLASMGVSEEEIKTALNSSSKFYPVAKATDILLRKKGWLNQEDLKQLQNLGITKEKLFDIITIIALKTITNYVNHIEHTELDEQFKN